LSFPVAKKALSAAVPDLAQLARLVIGVAENLPSLAPSRLAPEIDTVVYKPDGSWATDIDHTLQEALQTQLELLAPGYGFIGEEMQHADQVEVCNSSEQGYWVIDPLDGTTNFTSGFLCYGISVALVIDGQSKLAVIYDPVRKECFSAAAGQGAFLNGVRLDCRQERLLGNCIANVDYKRLVGEMAERLVRSPPYRSQRNLGSSVLEWCWLAAGRVQLYLHGGQKLWDFAGGYLVLTEAGGAATSLSGAPLDCTSLRKRSVVAAVSPDLLREWAGWLNINRFESQPPL